MQIALSASETGRKNEGKIAGIVKTPEKYR